MRAVAIVALGGLQISELRDFAVVRLEIARGDGLVAAAALIHDVQPEIGQVGALDAVRRVAVAAHRKRLGRGMRGGRVNARDEHFVDAAMALGAGSGHVGAVHARACIAGGQFQVRAVAIGAIGGHGQPGLEQPSSVDALGVVLDDVLLLPGVPQGGLLAGPVALGAEVGDVAREGR